MVRDESKIIRIDVVADVIGRAIKAIEKTHCTVEEEACALAMLITWVEDAVPSERKFDVAQARSHFLQLFPAIKVA